MPEIFILILLVLGIGSLLVTGVFHLSAHRLLGKQPVTHNAFPPISVFKPVKGVDDGLYENLVAMAVQDYPCFELIIGAQDPADPALQVARRVQRQYPNVSIRVVGGTGSFGHNPKVANLAGMARHASHEHWLISDSNVRPRKDYLRSMASELANPRVGLVSSLLVGTGQSRLGAVMENLHLNTFIVGSVSAAQMLAGHPCVIGKSMLFRRRDLQALGGFAAVKDVLAEDYLLGLAFHRAGFLVKQSTHVLPTINGQRSVQEFVSRHVRWTQLRRWINPAAYAGEALTHPTLWFVLLWIAGILGTSFGPLSPLHLVLMSSAGLAIKLTSDGILVARLQGSALPWVHLPIIVLKDILVAALWLAGGMRRTVHWRGNTYWIGPNSRLSNVPSLGSRLVQSLRKPLRSEA